MKVNKTKHFFIDEKGKRQVNKKELHTELGKELVHQHEKESVNTKHTPTPWVYGENLSGSENHKGFYIFQKGHNYHIIDVMPVDVDGDIGRANTQFVVRAVNSHEALLMIAKAYIELAKLHGKITTNAENVIAQAEGDKTNG